MAKCTEKETMQSVPNVNDSFVPSSFLGQWWRCIPKLSLPLPYQHPNQQFKVGLSTKGECAMPSHVYGQ